MGVALNIPKSSMFKGFSLINQAAIYWGTPMTMENLHYHQLSTITKQVLTIIIYRSSMNFT